MKSTKENIAAEALPTLAQRLWRTLGYRYHLGEEPEGAEAFSGWMKTEIGLQFGWRDRLRLLATGRLFVALTQYTSAQVDEAKSRTDWRIAPPFEDKR